MKYNMYYNCREELKEEIKTKTLVIVPAYNEALNIEKTIKDITTNSTYDYVIINDCSKDNTKEVCEKNGFNMVSLPINYGLTSGIQMGMKYAQKYGYDIAIQFDGDGQHSAKYLKKLVDEIENNKVDVAIGSRFVEEKKPFTARMMGSRLLSLAIRLTTFKKITDPTSGMRAYNKKAIKMFNSNSSLTPEPDTVVYMIKKGLRIKEVQVEMSDREFGESYLNAFKSIKYMMNMMMSIIVIRSFTRNKKNK